MGCTTGVFGVEYVCRCLLVLSGFGGGVGGLSSSCGPSLGSGAGDFSAAVRLFFFSDFRGEGFWSDEFRAGRDCGERESRFVGDFVESSFGDGKSGKISGFFSLIAEVEEGRVDMGIF